MRSRSLSHASLLLAACSLAACAARTNVSATANVPAQYSHVWVTIEDVKFNTSATAAASDSGWLDFPLSTPVTFDLSAVTSGGLALFGSALKVPTGTYAQMQLQLTDSKATLAASAQSAGLLYNDQVEYLNSSSVSTTAPLQLVHPEQGIILAVSLTIPSNAKAALDALNTSAATSGTTSATTTSGLATGTTTGTTTAATTTTGSSTCSTTTTNTTTTTPITTTTNDCATSATSTTFSVGIDFDAERDLVPFTFSGAPGFLLNPHLTAYDLTTAGTIQGQVSVTALPTSTTTASGTPDVEVSAETLSSDGARHVIVKSTPLLADGSFVLYPLATDASSAGASTATTYDLVIHGPQVQTVIIKSVPPSVSAPAAATSAALTTVSLASAADFLVNVSTATPFTTAGAVVQFYQTVPVSGEVPYVVAQQPIDPFNKNFAGNAALAAGPIAVSTYSGGTASAAVSEAPSEGAGTYQVAAIAPSFNDGVLGTKVAAPNPIPTTAVLVNIAPLTVATGATSAALTVKTAVAAPGRYNSGELVLSGNGAIIAVAALVPVLDQSSGTISFSRIPGGTASRALNSALYQLSAWVWNSADPTGTFTRESGSTSVDLRAVSAADASITID